MNTTFYQILANNLVANITNFTVWFAVTFWVYLQTNSVLATGVIAGIFLVFTAIFGFSLGSLVDHYPKKLVMLGSSVVSFGFYCAALAIVLLGPVERFAEVTSIWLWLLVLIAMFGMLAGNIRSIALPTLVTLMIPEDRRDKANGLVGMVTGIGFLTTSVISGFLVAWGGMVSTLLFALFFTALVFAHMLSVPIDENKPKAKAGEAPRARRVDIKGTIAVLAAVPGLFALIFLTTFNNFLGGVFIALLDAYGLSLVSVEVWGLLFGVVSCAFIVSGIVISRFGLGRNPLRTLLAGNLAIWVVCALFTIQSNIWLLIGGMAVWMFSLPWIEASEQTALQKLVPPERQGRVFGFAQSVEQSASPLTAFLVGPLTQFVFIPLMSEGGAGANLIGGWFGVGPERGIALVFTLAGLAGVVITAIAFNSKYYRRLSAAYAEAPEHADAAAAA